MSTVKKLSVDIDVSFAQILVGQINTIYSKNVLKLFICYRMKMKMSIMYNFICNQHSSFDLDQSVWKIKTVDIIFFSFSFILFYDLNSEDLFIFYTKFDK